jgi:hypothetical protein
MADKALTDPKSMLGAFLNTVKPEPVSKPHVAAVLAPVYDPRVLKGRVAPVGEDDGGKKATPGVMDAASELLKRLYGL